MAFLEVQCLGSFELVVLTIVPLAGKETYSFCNSDSEILSPKLPLIFSWRVNFAKQI